MQAEIYELMANVEDKHWWFVGRTRIVKSIIDRFSSKKSGMQILDAGCGSGGNFNMLKDYGNIYALEPETKAVEVANKRKLAKEVYQGYLEPKNKDIKDKKYDLIVMTDVLEHIPDDVEALQVIKDHLTDDGKYVMTVPAFMFLWGSHDTEHHHQRRYTVKELKKKFTDAGFKINFISYCNFWLFPAIALVRLFEKKSGKYDSKKDLKLPNPIVNSILKFLFTSEKYLLKLLKLPFGVSIVACVEKNK